MPKPKKKPPQHRKTPENKTRTSEDKLPDDVPVAGIAASAGGLRAFKELLSHLRVDTGVAYVLIQHLDPQHKSLLSELLSQGCSLPVREITDGMLVEPNHVYVIPPNQQLTLLHNQLHFLPKHDEARHYNPADVFFQSLADDRGGGAVGVVLSGTASDGTLGCRAIKEVGGITFAQDSESAEYDGMPASAVAAGCVDFVLPPREIAEELSRIARHPDWWPTRAGKDSEDILAASAEQMNKIFILLRSRTGHDFSYYKATTIKRRINRRMLVHGIDRVAQYIQLMQSDPREIDALFQDALINVTAFFRDPEAFEALHKVAFPALLDGRPADAPVRIWVPGCSTGQEAYSLAIALHEYLAERANLYQIQIFGSDIDETAIDKARAGIFPESIAQAISPARLQRYFHKVSGGYQVNKLLREMCVFAVQNVTKDPPFSRLDLLSCRNLLIYFGGMLQKRVLRIFHYALQPRGFLLLGTSETIGAQADLFALKDKKAKLYQKKSVAARYNDDLMFRHDQGMAAGEEPQRLEREVSGYDMEGEAERLLLKTYVPPGVIVTPDQTVVRFLGRTWPYIEPSAGTASLNLYKIAHPDLVVELRAAIHTIAKEGGKVRKPHVRLQVDGEERRVDIQVLSLGGVVRGEHNLLVMFEPCPSQPLEEPQAAPADKEGAALKTLAARNSELEREVRSTREYMQSIVEEQEGANQELRSANEEIQSTNEELQSTNEELETAKEELQSANEELSTVNDELENRNRELALVNDDFSNLLASVNLPILMLGSDLRIRQFTAPAEKLLNLIGADVGRPIGNIKPNIQILNLDREVLHVIDSMVTKVLEVQDDQGHWYSVRMRPYKTRDNRIEGAVITFVDIDSTKDIERLKQALSKERRLAAVVRDSNDAVTVQDLDGNIQAWNPAAERIYGYTEQEALRMNIRKTFLEQDHPALEQMQAAIRDGSFVEPMTAERLTKDGSTLKVRIIASALVDNRKTTMALATTERVLPD